MLFNRNHRRPFFWTKALHQAPKEQSNSSEASVAQVSVHQAKTRLVSGLWESSGRFCRWVLESGGYPLGCPGSCVQKLGTGPGKCGGSLFKNQTLVGWEVGHGLRKESYTLCDTVNG